MPFPHFHRRPDAPPADRADRDAPPPLGRSTGLQRLPAAGRRPSRRGIHRGTLTEWLADGEGAGATTLAVSAAREACRQGGTLVVVDADRSFYPPAAVRLGIAPEQLLVVRVDQRADHDSALDQALRCPAVAAVLAWPDALAGRFDDRTFRRLQLAAEAGGSLGLLLRGAEMRQAPSWADVRLLVQPLPAEAAHPARRLRVVLLRCRGGREGGSVELEFDDESHPLFTTASESRRSMPNPPSLETLAAWCQRFSPLVGIERTIEPASLLLDITGLGPPLRRRGGAGGAGPRRFCRPRPQGPTGHCRHARRRLGDCTF